MAKKFGKRRKSGGEPRDLFGAPPPPRSAPARPASSTPLADYLQANWPGVSEGYVVLPRSLAEGMSLPWQQQMAAMLSQFHQAHRGLNWPVYRVVPSRYENLVDLDEEQLAEAGYLVEIDADGEMVYRERSGRKVAEPESTTVLVSCLDPIPPRGSARAAEAAAAEPARPRAAPMIIPPAPVWRTTPTKPDADVPPLPEPPRQAPPRGTPEQAGEQGWAPDSPGAASVPGWAPGAPGAQSWAGQSIQGEPPSGQLPAAHPGPAPATTGHAGPEPAATGPEAPRTESEPGRAGEPPAPEQPVTPPPPDSPAGQAAPAPEPPAPAKSPPGDDDTPPRGIPLSDRGWFDPLPGEESSNGPADFGPTGDPTELPYRYRP